MEELVRNVMSKSPQIYERMLNVFRTVHFEVVSEAPDEAIIVWRDVGFGTDAPVLAAAALAQVDAFCTGDRGILGKETICESFGLTVVTPRWLLDQLS